MTAEAIEQAAVRNRLSRMAQIARISPMRYAARDAQESIRARRDGATQTRQTVALVDSLSHVPDFFPTPQSLVARMVAEAEISPGMAILEPSAGKGDIAKACVACGALVKCYEINHTLAGILRNAGLSVVCADFSEQAPQTRFDRVLMNPPFSNGQDARHVMHAFRFLKPGGRLVAITSEGPFFRGDKLSTEFRAFVDAKGTSERLLDGTFSGASSFRQTGVQTRIVILNA